MLPPGIRPTRRTFLAAATALTATTLLPAPVEGGYALSNFPNSREDAQVLRREIEKLWRRINA